MTSAETVDSLDKATVKALFDSINANGNPSIPGSGMWQEKARWEYLHHELQELRDSIHKAGLDLFAEWIGPAADFAREKHNALLDHADALLSCVQDMKSDTVGTSYRNFHGTADYMAEQMGYTVTNLRPIVKEHLGQQVYEPNAYVEMRGAISSMDSTYGYLSGILPDIPHP